MYEEAEEDLELPEMWEMVSGEFDMQVVMAGLLGEERCELREEVLETSTGLTERGGRQGGILQIWTSKEVLGGGCVGRGW